MHILLVCAPDLPPSHVKSLSWTWKRSSWYSKPKVARQGRYISAVRLNLPATGQGARTKIDQSQNAMHSRLRKHMHDRASRPPEPWPKSPNLLCNGRLVNPGIIIFLLIAARNAPAVVWERFLLHDCVIKHRFVSGEKPREGEIDGRRQSELYGSSIEMLSECEIKGMNGALTPRMYARSNRRAPTPTCIFVFMLLMSPGIMSGTETIIAAAARQFCEWHNARDAPSTFVKKDLQLHMYTCTFHEVGTLREHRHVCGVRANTRRQTHHQFQSSLIRRQGRKRVLTSVTMIPVIGPRKTV